MSVTCMNCKYKKAWQVTSDITCDTENVIWKAGMKMIKDGLKKQDKDRLNGDKE